jgi:hypothetical protein
VKNKIVILTSKSKDGVLPYCKTGAESDGNNQPGPLVSSAANWNSMVSDLLLIAFSNKWTYLLNAITTVTQSF